jgi:hypothetical protein
MGAHYETHGITHPASRRMRRSALSLVLLLLTAQVSFIVHLALNPHIVSSDTGRVEHPIDSTRHTNHVPKKPDHPERDNECRIFAVVTQASIAAVPQVLSVPAAFILNDVNLQSFEALHLSQSDLFRLSPSHSPPSLA